MAEHDGGSVGIDILPKISAAAWGREIRSRLDQTVEREGRRLGRTLADGMKAGFAPRRLEEAIKESRPRVDAEAAKAGRSAGRSFARGMKTELEARLKNLPEAKVKANVVLDPKSVERVRAQLASLGPFTTTINVDADTAAAMARLVALREEADRLFGRSATINVGANTGRAQSALFQLGVQMAVLGAIPLGATLAAGIGAIAASATAAGVGLAGMAAVAVPGVVRIREALQRQKAAQEDVTSATRTGTVAVNASAIAALQGQLRVQQMATAERQLTQAQQSARQAQSDLNAARRDASRGLVDMHNQATTSALSLRSDELAVERARMALDQLTSSRQDALAVQRAQLNLAKAQENLKGVQADPKSTQLQKDLAKLAVDAGQEAIKQAQAQAKAHELDRREAQLAYEQAVQRLKEQRLAYKRLVVDERAAARAGVEGSQQVRAAKQQLTQALDGVANAQRAIRAQQIQDRIATLQQADAMSQAAAATGQVSAAQAHLAQAMARLSPAERGLLRDWQAFAKAYRGWVNELEPDVLPVMSRGLGLVRSQLSKFTPMIKSSAAAVSLLELAAQRALDGPWWNRFIANLSIAAPHAIMYFGAIAGHTFTGLAGTLQAFLPYTDMVLGGIDRMAQGFSAWGTGLGASTGFIRFMSYVQQTAPEAGQTLKALASAIIDIARALAPLAALQLAILKPLSDGIAAVANNAPGLIQLAAAMWIVTKAARVMGISALISGLTGTGAAGGAAAGSMVRLGVVLRSVGAAMMGVSATSVTTRTALLGLAKLGAVIGVVVGVGYGMQKLQEQQNGAVQSTQDLTRSMLELARTGQFTGPFMEQFKAGALSGKTGMDAFAFSAKEIVNPSWTSRFIDHPAAQFFNVISAGAYNTPLSQAVDKFKTLDVTLAQMAQSGQATQAAAAFSDISNQLQRSGRHIDEVNRLFPTYSALSKSTSFNVAQLTAEVQRQNQAMSANARSFLSSQQQIIDFNGALSTANGLLASNGRAFWGNGQAALQNRGAVLATARIVQGYSDDLINNNQVTDASIKRLKGQKEQLIQLAMKFGLSRKEAKKYVDQLVKIPPKKDTTVGINAKGKFTMQGLKGNSLASLFTELVTPGSAGGGVISGGGGPRSDNRLTPTSSGEMVINAPATARHFPLLAAINDEGNHGTIYRGRGYAGGGVIGNIDPVPARASVHGYAGGGLIDTLTKSSYRDQYRYAGLAAAILAKASKGSGRGLTGMTEYAAGQTILAGTAISDLYANGGGPAVRFAQAQLGEPYVWGANGPNAWDCSSLTQQAWRAAGVSIPRVTYDQIEAGTPSSRQAAVRGDLVFPNRGHVMMVTGMGGAKALIHAPHTGDVVRYAPWRSGTVRHIAGHRGGAVYGGGNPKGFARSQLGELGWSGSQFHPLDLLWQRESGWRWNARNPSSGAYGIPQALPGSKMASFGRDWQTNWATQIRWGLDYIKHRYGSPAGAWAHSQRTGWYETGTDSARRGLAWVGENGPELVNFRGGEQVYPHEQSMRMATAALGAPAEVLDAGTSGSDTHMHAHFDGWTRASVQHEVATAFHVMSVQQAQPQRIGRRR